MLNNDAYTLLLLTKLKMEDFYKEAEVYSSARKNGKVITFIFQQTGKALVSTGNRLLNIA